MGITSAEEVAHDKMLDEVITEVEHMLSEHYDRQQVSKVLSVLSTQYQNARITTYLPILIYKDAHSYLDTVQLASASSARSDSPIAAHAAKLHFLRFEFKYILHDNLRTRLEQEISECMALDPFVAQKDNRSYIVRSLYYDDAAFSSYYQKIDGALLRSKFRLRTYTENPDEACATYLELKGRYNSLVFKRRAYFDSTAALLDGASVTEKLTRKIAGSPIGEQFMYELTHKQIKPVMLIDYVRQPYISRDNPDFRLTLDDHLYGTVTDRLFPEELSDRRPLLPGYTVMEIKFKNHIPLWFHRVITNYNLKRVSISKICKGIEVCNLVPALD